VTERAHAEALDAADPLAGFRDRFVFDDGDRIYVDGNSLGRLPRAVEERVAAVVEEWGSSLVGGWHEWIDLPVRLGDLVAREIVGARAGEVLVADSVTVNLYKLAAAALDRRPGVLVTAVDEFPTDRYVLQGLGEVRLLEPDPTPEAVAEACAPRDVALVCLSHVNYRSGALADLAGITEAAHYAGALVLWDVCHSAGVVPIDLSGVDLAVGCTYKYLNAGPGAPAFLYVREELQAELRSPIQGWFGQREQFAMGPAYDPEPGIARFLAGTPPIVALAAVEPAVELVAEAGVPALREKSVALTAYAIDLHDAWLAPLGFELGTPREPGRRGSHVSLRHPEGWRICRALIERANVVPDFRAPDSVRFGLPPLYMRFADVWDALDRLRRLVEDEVYLELDPAPGRVT
jgi:kynureninase